MIRRVTSTTNDVNPDAEREMYRRAGVSAFANVINFVETSWSLSPCRKAVFTSPDADTPIRRPVDRFLVDGPF